LKELRSLDDGGKWHHDETVIRCEAQNQWFWEMIDEDTRFLVASHLSETRTLEDTITVFRQAVENAKSRPQAIIVDGSHQYDAAFNRVFYSRYKVNRVELVKRIGIRSRETNNIVERLHETVKERTCAMRGVQERRFGPRHPERLCRELHFRKAAPVLEGKDSCRAGGNRGEGMEEPDRKRHTKGGPATAKSRANTNRSFAGG
jgi:hypothetical protein